MGMLSRDVYIFYIHLLFHHRLDEYIASLTNCSGKEINKNELLMAGFGGV